MSRIIYVKSKVFDAIERMRIGCQKELTWIDVCANLEKKYYVA